MKQYKPLPSAVQLSSTLARRLFELRELRNLTVKDLARMTRFSPQRIEDLEAGLETWLSTTDRQLLAKALAIEPSLLQEVETRIDTGQTPPPMASDSLINQLSEAILNGARNLECPDCGSTLKCSVQEGLDIEERTTRFAKAFCMKCPFVLR